MERPDVVLPVVRDVLEKRRAGQKGLALEGLF